MVDEGKKASIREFSNRLSVHNLIKSSFCSTARHRILYLYAFRYNNTTLPSIVRRRKKIDKRNNLALNQLFVLFYTFQNYG